jgi:methyl-accepting chemotaxis protein
MEELPSLLAAVDQDVNTFQNQQRETAKLSSMLAGELDSVTRTLGGVATSIQFHDITRQQVEHVIGALEGLLRSGSTADLSASGGALVRLQKAQLKSAAAAFAVSTAKIGSDLKGVAATVGEMAAGSNRIDGLGRQEKDSLLGGIESRFASIARAVTELHSLEHSTRATVTDLQSVSQDLGVAVSEIQSIEIQLSMISLNAVISANHIAAQGEVLIVIAGAIRELRMKSALRSSDAKAAIHSISEAVQSFQRIYTEGAAEAGDASEETFLANLNHDVGDLQSAGASNAAAAAAVAALADTLVASLQKARDHFAIGDLFAETAGRCCRLLDAVAAQAQPPGASDAALPWNLDESYTMQAERDVQRALSGELKDAPFDAGSRHLPVESEPEVEFF